MSAPVASGRVTRNGFTLLEILVALVVFGFVAAGLAQGVRFGLQAWATQGRRLAQQGDMDAVDRALRRLIEDADGGEADQPPPLRGGAHALALLTRLPSGLAAAGDAAEVAIGVDGEQRLVVRAMPQPHAERLRPEPAIQSVLLEHVDHIDLSYFAGAAHAWATVWQAASLPDLVRLRIVFPKGDRRHWPDLVASPMQSPSVQ